MHNKILTNKERFFTALFSFIAGLILSLIIKLFLGFASLVDLMLFAGAGGIIFLLLGVTFPRWMIRFLTPVFFVLGGIGS